MLVSRGVVLRDAVFGESELQRELELALNRVEPDADGERRLFLHRNVSLAPELDPDCRGETLNVTVNQWIDRLSRSDSGGAPELHSLEDFPEVVLWNAVWTWTRRVVLAVLFAGAAWFAYDWWLALQPDEPVDTGPRGPTSAQRAYREFRFNPDPGVLIPAIHRAYRDFVGDPRYGKLWRVGALSWSEVDAGTLKIDASLRMPSPQPVRGEAEAGGASFELSDELRRSIIAHAQGLGWKLDLNGSQAAVRVPVKIVPRTEEEAESIRLPEPQDERERWHWKKLIEDLEVLGPARVVNDRTHPDREPLYLERKMSLKLRGIEWSSWDIAAWLGGLLAGGPVTIEKLVLQPVEGTASMGGELRFRMAWCVKFDPATRRCADVE